MENIKVEDLKADAIKLIASSTCFIVITYDQKTCERRGMINDPLSAILFMAEMKKVENDLLFRGNNPSPSSIIKQ